MRKYISILLSAATFIASASIPFMMMSSRVSASNTKDTTSIVLSDPESSFSSDDQSEGIPSDTVTMDKDTSVPQLAPSIAPTSSPTVTTPAIPNATTTPPPASEIEKQIEAFVTRFYQLCLNRKPDTQGMQNWKSQLLSGTRTGSDIAFGFIFSKEFIDSNVSNEEFVRILYLSFFDREADTNGFNLWKADLDAGLSRLYVLHGFVESQEFSDLCERFGITRGSLPLESASDLNPQISKFVIRFYRLCLIREADPTGLNDWVSKLVTKKSKGADVAMGFVFSDEFVAKNVTNDEFINILYKAFFDRTPDGVGKASWISMLEAGTDRRVVLAGFVNSTEFAGLSKSYGIDPGYLSPTRVSGDPRADLASYCRYFIGVTYRYGSSDPAVGFDCSGFVKYIYQTKYGIELEHGSYYICDDGIEVSFDEMQPGDILCYADSSGYYYHVALYIGDGKMIHASTRRNSIVEDPATGMGTPGTIRRILPTEG